MLRCFAMFSSRLPPYPKQGSGKCESVPCFLWFKLPGGFNTGELAYRKGGVQVAGGRGAPRRRDVAVPRTLPWKQPFLARPRFPFTPPWLGPTPTRVPPWAMHLWVLNKTLSSCSLFLALVLSSNLHPPAFAASASRGPCPVFPAHSSPRQTSLLIPTAAGTQG